MPAPTLSAVRRVQLVDGEGLPTPGPSAANDAAALSILTRRIAQGEFLKAASAANNNAELITTGQNAVVQVRGFNTTAAVIYLKLYNLTRSPVPATDPPRSVIALAPGANVVDMCGRLFPLGVAFLLVTGAADTDNTAVTAGAVTALSISVSPIA